MEARIDVSHRADRDDARPHKLTFDVAAAMLGERIKKSRVAAPDRRWHVRPQLLVISRDLAARGIVALRAGPRVFR